MSNENCGVVWFDLGDGRRVSGSYEVSKKVMTVTSNGRSKKTQIGGMKKEILAKMLLRELMQELMQELIAEALGEVRA